jgi:general secretion pathway protein A
MYSDFFGFSEKPFNVTPDPRFLYLSPSHGETLASLIYGIRERRGFIAVVGEVGTGKTTLINAVLDRIDETTKVAYLFNTDMSFKQMLVTILAELELVSPDENLSKMELINRLNNFAIQQLSEGGNVVIIVDEAQNLSPRAMESLRLLSNLETRQHKLVQIILSGQPELDIKLNLPELRQLTQRISLKRYIAPLNGKETYEYLQHRLTVAGCNDSSLFSSGARQLIWKYSNGLPRKINVLCDNAFLIGFGLGKKKIGSAVVQEAIKDLSWSPFLETTETVIPEAVQSALEIEKKSYSRVAVLMNLILAASLIFGIAFFTLTSMRSGLHSEPLPVSGRVASLPVNYGAEKPTVKETLPDKTEIEEQLLVSEEKAAELLGNDQNETKTVKKLTAFPAEIEIESPLETEKKASALSLKAEKKGPKAGYETGFDQVYNYLIEQNKEASAKDKAPNRTLNWVVAKQNDYLSLIIERTYGIYSKDMLEPVLRLNPDIQDPNRISIGQVIKLP